MPEFNMFNLPGRDPVEALMEMVKNGEMSVFDAIAISIQHGRPENDITLPLHAALHALDAGHLCEHIKFAEVHPGASHFGFGMACEPGFDVSSLHPEMQVKMTKAVLCVIRAGGMNASIEDGKIVIHGEDCPHATVDIDAEVASFRTELDTDNPWSRWMG